MRVQRLAYPDQGQVARVLESLTRHGASVLQIGTAQFPAGLRSPAAGFHTRDADEIALVLEGRFETIAGDDVRVLGPGDFVVIPAGEPNASRALEPSKVLWIMYAPEGTPPP
jgi:quercetin dioxygenase-like cupin family protein